MVEALREGGNTNKAFIESAQREAKAGIRSCSYWPIDAYIAVNKCHGTCFVQYRPRPQEEVPTRLVVPAPLGLR